MNALINIFRTIFICIVLGLSGWIFSKDANDLALRPIERMIKKVNRLAANPLSSQNETIIDTNTKKG